MNIINSIKTLIDSFDNELLKNQTIYNNIILYDEDESCVLTYEENNKLCVLENEVEVLLKLIEIDEFLKNPSYLNNKSLHEYLKIYSIINSDYLQTKEIYNIKLVSKPYNKLELHYKYKLADYCVIDNKIIKDTLLLFSSLKDNDEIEMNYLGILSKKASVTESNIENNKLNDSKILTSALTSMINKSNKNGIYSEKDIIKTSDCFKLYKKLDNETLKNAGFSNIVLDGFLNISMSYRYIDKTYYITDKKVIYDSLLALSQFEKGDLIEMSKDGTISKHTPKIISNEEAQIIENNERMKLECQKLRDNLNYKYLNSIGFSEITYQTWLGVNAFCYKYKGCNYSITSNTKDIYDTLLVLSELKQDDEIIISNTKSNNAISILKKENDVATPSNTSSNANVDIETQTILDLYDTLDRDVLKNNGYNDIKLNESMLLKDTFSLEYKNKYNSDIYILPYNVIPTLKSFHNIMNQNNKNNMNNITDTKEEVQTKSESIESTVDTRTKNIIQNIKDIEKQIDDIKKDKTELIKNQKYEECIILRDKERLLLNELSINKECYQKLFKHIANS